MLYLHFFIGNLGFIFCKEPIYILCHFFLTRWVKFVEIPFFVASIGILVFCQLHALQESFHSLFCFLTFFIKPSVLCVYHFNVIDFINFKFLDLYFCVLIKKFTCYLKKKEIVILMYIYKDK